MAQMEIETNFVRVSGSEHGVIEGATRKAIYERAIQLSLELCPVEV
jgi:hypothetical protein